jgi:hypothetical protein
LPPDEHPEYHNRYGASGSWHLFLLRALQQRKHRPVDMVEGEKMFPSALPEAAPSHVRLLPGDGLDLKRGKN